MKKGNFSVIALLTSALAISVYADKAQLQQLPPSVQAKIRAQVGSDQIDDIDRDIRNGQPVYEVGFKHNGQQTELKFDQNGSLIGSHGGAITSSSTAPTAAQLDNRKLTREELPVMVRRAIDSRLRGMEINDIEREVKNGQVTYGIGYKQAGGVGPQQELVMSDNGHIIRSSAGLTDSAIASSGVTSRSAIGGYPATSSSSGWNSTITYQEVPQKVRSVAEANLHYGDVKRVERRMQNGEVDYAIDFLKNNGQYQEMVISEDGRIVANQMLPSNAVGTPGTVQSGTSSSAVNTNNPSIWNRLGDALSNKQK